MKMKSKLTANDLAQIAHDAGAEIYDSLIKPGFDQGNILPLLDEQQTIIATGIVHTAAVVVQRIAWRVKKDGLDITDLADLDVIKFNAAICEVFGKPEASIHIKTKKPKP